jgi:DNA-directed RNA polymerase subunit RPC12/RpoP
MAIEIIKRGTPRSERKFDARCVSCKTEFTFQAADAKLELDMRDGNFYRIQCPVCGHECTRNTQ